MNLNQYREELQEELTAILQYWMKFAPDEKDGGFFGRIDEEGKPVSGSPKGVVLNSRILWTFSAALSQTPNPAYAAMAKRAYEYLLTHFFDKEYGGVYWSTDHLGAPLNDRKQIYGLAFALYALSEYYLATTYQPALEEAIGLYRLIERHSSEEQYRGYLEAFTRDWQALHDQRLSEKDENLPKTMNTHLHIIEAYTNLYRAWPDQQLRGRIANLLQLFFNRIVRKGHLLLFFQNDWTPRSTTISYGHEIEASWLLQDAAEKLGNRAWLDYTPGLAMVLANSAAKGLDGDGGLWYERDGDHITAEKHWWPQAEAMVGFFNAWELSGDARWLERSMASWQFVKKYLRDHLQGEWWWGVGKDHTPIPGQDKAGFWKCPYHNSRACMELIRRIEKSQILV